MSWPRLLCDQITVTSGTPARRTASGTDGEAANQVFNFPGAPRSDPVSWGFPAEDARTAMALADRMADRALALGGTISGEHGIGYGKLGKMAAEHGAAWGVMGQIKAALDPQNLLNPGKLTPQPRL